MTKRELPPLVVGHVVDDAGERLASERVEEVAL